MAKRLQYRRLLTLMVLLAGAFAGLGYRLVDLQVVRHDELAAKAQHNTRREILFEPRRGDILDIKGNLLATSMFDKSICADPTLIGNHQSEIAHAIAPFLGMSEADLAQKLQPRLLHVDSGGTNVSHFVMLKRRVTAETWQKIQGAMTNLSFGLDEKKLPKTDQGFYRLLREKSVYATDFPVRFYPNQSLASHILGFTTTDDIEINSNRIAQIAGRDGIELTLNSKLSGVPGWRLTEADRRGRELVSWREQDVEPRDGLNVVLTIDSFIQHTVEAALSEAVEKHAPISATAIVIRPRTGEVLAMATMPDFDPADPGSAPAEARRNRVISDMVEPGSTFKIVVVSGALNERIVNLNDSFDCEQGHFAYAGRVLHDHEPYGVLSVQHIIMKSSNIGAAKVGIRMGESHLHDYISAFGFGDKTGIPLPGEISCQNFVRPVKTWSKVSIAQIPMGQGIGVTRLQMMMAMCAIANHGRLMRPMLIDRLEDQDGHVAARYAPQMVRQVINEPAAKLMVEALKTVVSSEGTAPKAALDRYTVAGKTGTAQKVENGTYVHGKYISSFIGFFPADNPELCISIVLDEPKEGYYGGLVAAPVFRQIAESTATYLNIRPDVDEKVKPLPTLVQKEPPARAMVSR
jgi:cell division protein FtsI/penicillin-binding protein 2